MARKKVPLKQKKEKYLENLEVQNSALKKILKKLERTKSNSKNKNK